MTGGGKLEKDELWVLLLSCTAVEAGGMSLRKRRGQEGVGEEDKA